MVNIVLDTDTGIDDSIAILIAAVSKEINLLAITGTYGNVMVEEGVRNSLSILSLLGRSDVPVYMGRDRALDAKAPYVPHEVSRRIHGRSGSGNITLPLSGRKAENESAVEYLQALMERCSDVTIVTTGPLTNLASVLISSPSLRSWKGRIVSMGGALMTRGNINTAAEANIHKDPEAAKIVFESGINLTMIGLDVTEKSRLYRSDAEKWMSIGSEKGRVFSSLLSYYIDNTLGGNDTFVHDPSAVIFAIHPEYFTLLSLPLTVELKEPDRGRTLLDEKRILERNNSTSVAIDVEKEKVEAYLSTLSSFLKN
ncbi:MAG: nucleoside hydrolase [Candidatus Ornithospirochaeta sp.]